MRCVPLSRTASCLTSSHQRLSGFVFGSSNLRLVGGHASATDLRCDPVKSSVGPMGDPRAHFPGALPRSTPQQCLNYVGMLRATGALPACRRSPGVPLNRSPPPFCETAFARTPQGYVGLRNMCHSQSLVSSVSLSGREVGASRQRLRLRAFLYVKTVICPRRAEDDSAVA